MTLAAAAACDAASDDGGDGPFAAPSTPAADAAAEPDAATAASDASADAGDGPPARLADPPLPAFDPRPGSGLSLGVVSGRIYDDLADHADERMRDLSALGARVLRIEIEQGTPLAKYATIVAAAKRAGVEVLALFTQNSVPGQPSPMNGTRADFDGTFVPAYLQAIDDATKAIPDLRYVEVGNEPDVYSFEPFFSYANGVCTPLEGSFRYALLAVRVFETMNERRLKGVVTPTVVGFDFSRQDDACVRHAAVDAQPIASHRAAYRPSHGLPDGLPTDIVSIHGYGQPNRIPGEPGYTYAGGTFADGVAAFLGATFADGASVVGAAPVWYSELGFCQNGIGGPDPAARQALAITRATETLRAHPQVTAAFVYSYRDDEGAGIETCGVRGNSGASFAPHPSYAALQAATVAGKDVVAPSGELAIAGGGATSFAPGAAVALTGWAIDADGAAPRVAVAIDGQVVTELVDGATPNARACTVGSSPRCPAVGFAATVAAPTSAGVHEVAARATDRAGNARVIGRIDVRVVP